jgi:hypothetical protein
MAYIIRLTERTNFRAAESRSDGEATTLRDASHVYSAKYLREMRGRWNEAHLSYKLSKPFVQEAAVVDFQTMLDALVQSGTKVYLILMPYHPRAAGCESQELCEALRASEAAAKHIAAKTHIAICGSFFSDLRSEDFVSDMFVDPAAFNLQEPCR